MYLFTACIYLIFLCAYERCSIDKKSAFEQNKSQENDDNCAVRCEDSA